MGKALPLSLLAITHPKSWHFGLTQKPRGSALLWTFCPLREGPREDLFLYPALATDFMGWVPLGWCGLSGGERVGPLSSGDVSWKVLRGVR